MLVSPNLDRVTIVGATDSVISRMPTTRGKGRIFKVFEFLSELAPGGTTDLGDAMKTFVAQHKRRGLAVLISDLYDSGRLRARHQHAAFHKFEPFVLHVVDQKEARPELKGDVRLYDCETGEEREVTVTDSLLDDMARAFSDYQKKIERFCTSRQVPYFAADVGIPFDELVLRVFRRGGFLR